MSNTLTGTEFVEEVEDYFYDTDVSTESVEREGDETIVRLTLPNGNFYEVWQEKGYFCVASNFENFGSFLDLSDALYRVK